MKRVVVGLALLLTGCFNVNPGNGLYACGTGAKACPTGFHCAADNTCWRDGSDPDLAITPTDDMGDSQCSDGVQDGDESDVDCGGTTCTKCVGGKSCKADGDCISGSCNAATHQCAASQCDDGVKDGSETDVDCGGTTCPKCGDTKACAAGGDCTSGFCSAVTHICVANQCLDQTKDGNEVDVDCGGGSCPTCTVGKSCSVDMDCASMSCSTGHVCVSTQCQDGTKDGNETDVDCGGNVCMPCGLNQGCLADSDCTSTFCNKTTGKCVATQCQDGRKDGSETDVDCGGGTCGLCALGQTCSVGTRDCSSTFCNKTTNVCVSSHCQDAFTDADETDVDCGGPTCTSCAANRACTTNTDCSTGSCVSSFCQLATGTPSWVTGPSLISPRAGHAMVLALDGRLFAIDGFYDTNGDLQPDIEALAPGGTWTGGFAAKPTKVCYFGAAVGSDGRIYTVDGYVGGSPDRTTAVEAFDPTAGTWSTAAGLSLGRLGHAVVSVGGKIFSIGGEDTNTVTGELDTFAPGATSWTNVAPGMQNPRYYHAAAVGPNGLIYVIGGYSKSTAALTGAVETYDPAANKWGTAASMKAARDTHSAVTGADGRVYAIGGNDGTVLSTVEAYTPATNTWTPVAQLPAGRAFGAAAVGADGRIYFTGGNSTTSNSPTTTTYVYGPSVTTAATGGVGSMQTISGSNFAANAHVSVYFGTITTPVATGTTNASGAISPAITFTVPNVANGSYTVKVIDDRAQYPALAKFSVM